jgi:hypothetical protein
MKTEKKSNRKKENIRQRYEVGTQDVTEVLREAIDYLGGAQTSLNTALRLREVMCMTDTN